MRSKLLIALLIGIMAAAPIMVMAEEMTATASAPGVGGDDVVVEVTATPNRIVSIEVTEHQETPGIGSVAADELPGMIVEAQSLDVDVIAGATETSEAIKTATAAALESMGVDLDALQPGSAAPEPTAAETPAAEDADLETRIETLEERVAALEAQLAGSAPEGVSTTPDQVAGELPEIGTNDICVVDNGCSLKYKRSELGKDYKNEDCVILYFDYLNESGKSTDAGSCFIVKVFQHDKEVDTASISPSENEAIKNRNTEVRSGAAIMEVAYAFKISDMTDIIVELSPIFSFGDDIIEFAVTLE